MRSIPASTDFPRCSDVSSSFWIPWRASAAFFFACAFAFPFPPALASASRRSISRMSRSIFPNRRRISAWGSSPGAVTPGNGMGTGACECFGSSGLAVRIASAVRAGAPNMDRSWFMVFSSAVESAQLASVCQGPRGYPGGRRARLPSWFLGGRIRKAQPPAKLLEQVARALVAVRQASEVLEEHRIGVCAFGDPRVGGLELLQGVEVLDFELAQELELGRVGHQPVLAALSTLRPTRRRFLLTAPLLLELERLVEPGETLLDVLLEALHAFAALEAAFLAQIAIDAPEVASGLVQNLGEDEALLGADRLLDFGCARGEALLRLGDLAQAQSLGVRRGIPGFARAVDLGRLLHPFAVRFEHALHLLGDLEQELLGAQLLVLLFFVRELTQGLAHLALGVFLGALRALKVRLVEGFLGLARARSGLREARAGLRRVALLVPPREIEELAADLLLLFCQLLRFLAGLRAGWIPRLARPLGGLLEVFGR